MDEGQKILQYVSCRQYLALTCLLIFTHNAIQNGCIYYVKCRIVCSFGLHAKSDPYNYMLCEPTWDIAGPMLGSRAPRSNFSSLVGLGLGATACNRAAMSCDLMMGPGMFLGSHPHFYKARASAFSCGQERQQWMGLRTRTHCEGASLLYPKDPITF